MKTQKLMHTVWFLGAIGLSVFLLFFVITCTWIGYEAKKLCQDAKREYQTADCVDGLIALVDDDSRGFRARNNAIWALGQMGDRRALPVLQKYYTGNIPNREPLDEIISQYELKKAINLAGGGFNMTAIFWR